MRRRDVLIGGAAITLGGGLSGCDLFADPKRLRILGLAGAIPSRIVKAFETQFNKPTELKTEPTPDAIWKFLKDTVEPVKVPDVASLGDAWLDLAIAQHLISPLTITSIPQWQNLSPLWKQAVTRNGKVWGIPYRWGLTAIAYRSDKLDIPINGWADLWRTELKGKITLPNDPREVIGLTLKKLGYSYNTANIKAIAPLTPALQALNQQVLTYTSDSYLQPLLIGDSWLAVGWSQDIVNTAEQNSDIKVVIPAEGTALWSDLWVFPQRVNRPENQIFGQDWLDLCLTPAIANQITALTDATATNPDLGKLPKSVTSNILKFPPDQILAKSELILPLSETSNQEYKQLWENLRQA